MARFVLRFLDSEVDLSPGCLSIGRDPRCDIAIWSPLASRKHALLWVGEHAVTFTDLGSRNGSRVNGLSVRGSRILRLGDRIRIGDEEFVFDLSGVGAAAFTNKSPSHRELPAWAMLVRPEEAQSPRTNPLHLAALAAEFAMARGRTDEAERLLRRLLDELRGDIRAGKRPVPERIEEAACLAVHLAEATGRGGWIDWVFEIYGTAQLPVPANLVDTLASAAAKLAPPAC